MPISLVLLSVYTNTKLIAEYTTSATTIVNISSCISHVAKPPSGLVETSDEQFLKRVIGEEKGEGKLCKGKVFVVKEPVKVYQESSSDPYTIAPMELLGPRRPTPNTLMKYLGPI
ncbi:hypothetical protein [Spartinivicinus ruber]|uniref:hypothetical protein n=1 Tax=Spartinivicinus ruber TaxID=2683272 RepID=UPI0013D17B10|nr:hypothetical protein [Spartinivicinus ruber]